MNFPDNSLDSLEGVRRGRIRRFENFSTRKAVAVLDLLLPQNRQALVIHLVKTVKPIKRGAK